MKNKLQIELSFTWNFAIYIPFEKSSFLSLLDNKQNSLSSFKVMLYMNM